MKKKIVIGLLSLFIIFLGGAPATASAQEGGGIGVCTYYSANGFKSQKACNSWLANKQKLNQPAWQKKLGKCLIAGGFSVAPSIVVKSLAMSPAGFAATYGTTVIGCMFG